jgi:hypothetical protein
VVERQELHARVYRLGGYLRVAEATFVPSQYLQTLHLPVGEMSLPGMMYVRLRSALSICDTCPAFLVIKSSYMLSHFGGSDRSWLAVGRVDLAPGLGVADGADMARVLVGSRPQLGVESSRASSAMRCAMKRARSGERNQTSGRQACTSKLMVLMDAGSW